MELKELLCELNGYIEDPTQGLPEEVFLFATEITPMVNVDLLIRDNRGRILLAWRKDEFSGQGWHIPGGIIRLKETIEERIQKTAWKEVGCGVKACDKPAEIVPIIHREQKTRGHFITLVYECELLDKKEIQNKDKKPGEPGYLAWHESYPSDMIPVHSFYKKYFNR